MFTITHMWIKDSSREIDIINQERPLPHKLEKSTFGRHGFGRILLKIKIMFQNVRIELSNGKIYKSRKK